MLTETEIKYIRVIYQLEEEGMPIVGPNDIAMTLDVSRASAHEILTKLTKKGILTHFKRKGFKFTEFGRQIAIKIIRTHRILEIFFVTHAGLSADEACKCISGIEFRFPQDRIEALYEKLGSPECCPHGKPIPNIDE